MKKYKVFILLEATLGGTRKHVIDILERIDQDMFDITFGYSTLRADKNFFTDLEEIKKRGIRCWRVEMTRGIAPIADLKALFYLYTYIRKEKFDIVHCHSSKAGFLGRVAAKIASSGIKTIYTPNSMAFNVNPVFKYIEKMALLFTDRIIAVSESEKIEIAGQLKGTKTICINSGVKTYPVSLRSDCLNREFKISYDKCIVVSIGRFTFQKDPLTFFKAAARCITFNKNLHFVWIGDGELRGDVEKFIADHDIADFFTLAGWRTDVESLLWGGDLFVLSSVYESFGYVTCEAMSHFLPVVATKVVGTSDIVLEGETGFLIPKGDMASLSDKILTLANNNSLRAEMGSKSAARIAAHFNVDKMVEDIEKLYVQIRN